MIIFFSAAFVFMFEGCNVNNPGCGGIDPGIIPQPPYDSPIWHPRRQFIGFNHIPLKKINYPYGQGCWGEQQWDGTSGFWLINPDGTNMRKIFPYTLLSPSWSPDGHWIAFSAGAQIYKMKFTGTTFDTTSLVKLTTEGRNFLPAWSTDGQWIAYTESICEGTNTCGVWLMRSDGTQRKFLVAYGNYPCWDKSGKKILYITRAVTNSGNVIGDSLWTFDTNTNAKSFLYLLSGENFDNRSPKYAPDRTRIAFWSSGNLWIMDSTGGNLRKLTTQGVDVSFGLPFSWSPDGSSIVYTDYRSDDWGYNNGTLWILNPNTGGKKQLTFNLQTKD